MNNSRPHRQSFAAPRLRRLLFCLFISLFAAGFAVSAPGTAAAEGSKPAKSSAKSANSASKSKNQTKSGNKNTSAKKSAKPAAKSKNDKKSAAKSSKSSSKFSKEEIARYREMPVETWKSPRETSELGLPIAQGYAQPYPYGNLMRQYDGNRCRHRGLDIGAVGEKNGGLGTVVNSATPGVITLIGKAGGDVGEFGKLDKRTGNAKRTGKSYPRQILVPGYGLVYPFSRTYGRWRSGTVIVVRVTDGPLKDYALRYMHLADTRPDLKVGDTVAPGEHIAIMGGTAIMDSWPHVHIDMSDPAGNRVDPAPYFGLKETASHCAAAKKSAKSAKSAKSKQSKSAKPKSAKKSSAPKSSKSASAPKTAARVAKRPRSSYVGTQNAAAAMQTRTLIRSQV